MCVGSHGAQVISYRPAHTSLTPARKQVGHNGAQPAIACLMMVLRKPMLPDCEFIDLERTGVNSNVVHSCQCLPDVSWQRGDQIGRLDDRAEPEHARKLEYNIAFYVLAQQRLLEQLRARPGGNGHVPLATVLLDTEPGAHTWMVRIGETDPVLHIELLLIHAAAEPRYMPDRQIGLAGFERAPRV